MGELTGTTFAGLEVRDAIGRDLVSTVYEAVEADGDRVVALRVVAEDLCADDGPERELYERFLRRARAALTFEHPDAPRTEEVGEHRGRGYMISTHVQTVPFSEFVSERGPLDVDSALALFAQVADVLDAGHRAGLTHGAVNPSTLRIVAPAGDDPDVSLTGFGIGALLELRLRRDRRQLRDVDELLYVAPEQLRSQPLTGRTDQYALACALVHALTGAPPFVRDSVGGLFGAHLFVTPTFEDHVEVSQTAVLKALAKQPRDRYATCGQMIADVARSGRSARNRRLADQRRREAVVVDPIEGREVDGPEVSGPPTDDEVAAGAHDHEDARSKAADERVVVRTIAADDEDLEAAAPDRATTVATDQPERVIVLPAVTGDPIPDDADADAVAGAAADGAIEHDAPAAPDGDEPGPDEAAGAPATGRANGTGAVPSAQWARRAGSAPSNGDRSTPAQSRAEGAPVENSSTGGSPGPAMAYPASRDEPDADPGEDLDDVPLLSEVLRRRPYRPEPAVQRPSAVLVALIVVAVMVMVAILWFVLA